MTPASLSVVLTDGLGNQMFQYAAARAAAAARKLPLYIDSSSGFTWNIHGRSYALDGFQVSAPVHSARPSRFAHAAIRRCEDIAMRHGRYYLAPLHNWLCSRARHVTGFFQSPAYFQNAESLVRREFQPLHSPPPAIAALAATFCHPDSIGLHVRLQHAFSATGERVTPQLSGPAYERQIVDYYRSAVAFVQQQIPQPRWLIVSDTHPFDPALLGIRGPVTMHYPDPAIPALWDQWLLSQCEHVIIGRSTFSWWAAWLSGSRRGLTCAPAIFRPGGALRPARDLYPAGWRTF